MEELREFLNNPYFWCGFTAWLLAQLLKVPTYWLVEKRLDWSRLKGAGGMPSSHTAMVLSLAIMIGAKEGFHTSLFALSLAFAVVVMYDAAGVRRETGKQSVVINEILHRVLVNGKRISNDELKELVGHTPFEVLGGAIVGIVTALVWSSIV